MIRINHSGGVPFFQNDTSYNLPSSEEHKKKMSEARKLYLERRRNGAN